jgi:hypothetical protein
MFSQTYSSWSGVFGAKKDGHTALLPHCIEERGRRKAMYAIPKK